MVFGSEERVAHLHLVLANARRLIAGPPQAMAECEDHQAAAQPEVVGVRPTAVP
jgi:hypothetical protein